MGALCFKELCFTHCHDLNQEWRLYITPLIWHDDFISPWRVSIPRYDNFPLIPGDLNPSFRDTFSNIDNFIIFGRKCAFFNNNEAKTLNLMIKFTKDTKVWYTVCTGSPNLTYDGYTSPDVTMKSVHSLHVYYVNFCISSLLSTK